MCGRRHRRRQQRGIIATALLAAFKEYQSKRALTPSGPSRSAPFQGATISGVTYKEPEYTEPVNPHPPTYEEIAGERKYPTLSEEKSHINRSVDAPIPPHAYEAETYTHNSTSVSRLEPNRDNLEHLLAAITLYFDTQIKLNEGNTSKVRQLEMKKERKLAKAERKFNAHMAKGKDQYDMKMAKQAEKMENWTEWSIEKHVDRDTYGGSRRQAGCHGQAHRANIRNTGQDYQSTVA